MRRNFHPESVKRAAIETFSATWQEYPSPSAAAKAIATELGIGRTTLSEWLQAEGKWPHTRVSANLKLARENKKLRKQIEELKTDD